MPKLFEDQSIQEPFKGRIIYETRGRAREYCELAASIYRGCDHGCKYCYVPGVLRITHQEFRRSKKRPDGTMRKFKLDAQDLQRRGETRHIMFSFTTDPYNHIDEKLGRTREALIILKEHGLRFCTLTKGGSRSLRDIDLFTADDMYACTLTSLDDQISKEWEPGAALPADRISALKKFHDKGIFTWVSLEPVIDTDQTIEIIRATHEWVDQYKVGTLNHHQHGKTIDWPQFASDVLSQLNSVGADYYIKADLRKHLT